MSKYNEQITNTQFFDLPVIERTFDVDSIDKKSKLKKTNNFTHRSIDAEKLDPYTLGQVHFRLMCNIKDGLYQYTSYVYFHNYTRKRVESLASFLEFPSDSLNTGNRNPNRYYGIRRVLTSIKKSGRSTMSAEVDYIDKFSVGLTKYLNGIRGTKRGNTGLPPFRTTVLKDKQHKFIPFTAAAIILPENNEFPIIVLAIGDFTTIIRLGEIPSNSKASKFVATGVYDYRRDDANMLNFFEMEDDLDKGLDMPVVETEYLNEMVEGDSAGMKAIHSSENAGLNENLVIDGNIESTPIKPALKEVVLPIDIQKPVQKIAEVSFMSKHNQRVIKKREAELKLAHAKYGSSPLLYNQN
ncbi:MAG: hypothetical protein RPS47_18895 [Colwellia sp.]